MPEKLPKLNLAGSNPITRLINTNWQIKPPNGPKIRPIHMIAASVSVLWQMAFPCDIEGLFSL